MAQKQKEIQAYRIDFDSIVLSFIEGFRIPKMALWTLGLWTLGLGVRILPSQPEFKFQQTVLKKVFVKVIDCASEKVNSYI